jgi:hypothetical protein
MYARLVYGFLGCSCLASAASFIAFTSPAAQLLMAALSVAPAFFVGVLYCAEAVLPKRYFADMEAEVGAVTLHVSAALLALYGYAVPLPTSEYVGLRLPSNLEHLKIALYLTALMMSTVRVTLYVRKLRRQKVA